MAYFPLFVNLEGRRVLVVGGGKIAARRIRTLLEFGCEITVVAPEVGEELLEMLDPDAGTVYAEEERKSEKVTPGSCRIIWKRKKYEIKDPEAISADPMETDKFTFVLAAATPEVNAQVVRECRKKISRSTMRRTGINVIFIFRGLRRMATRSSESHPVGEIISWRRRFRRLCGTYYMSKIFRFRP